MGLVRLVKSRKDRARLKLAAIALYARYEQTDDRVGGRGKRLELKARL